MPLVPPPPLPPVVFTGERPSAQRVSAADPLTLRPTGPSARLPAAGLGYERSPGGGSIAVLGLREGPGGRDRGFAVSVVDTAAWRTVRTLRLGLDSGAMAWLREDRLLVSDGRGVRVLDPTTLRPVRTVRLPGEALRLTQVGDRLAAIVSVDDDRPPRLLLLDAEGTVTSDVELPFEDLDAAVLPDVTLDPVTGRVVLVGGVGTRFELDPATGAVTIATFRNRALPLEWRGPRLLVGGAWPLARGRPVLRFLADGGAVTATVRLPRRTAVARDGDGILTLSPRSATGWDPTGRRLWTHRTSRRPDGVISAGRAYVTTGRRTVVLDAVTGRRLATARPLPLTRLVVDEADGIVFVSEPLGR